MHITLLQLKNFRNYQLLELPLSAHSCIFTGQNGQGKTNLLEAVALVSTGRSHRTNREKDMIMHGQDFARVRVETQQRDGKHTLDLVLSRNEKKRVQVNGLPISRIGDMLGQIKSITFSPEDLNLIKEGPAQRRRFMDLFLSQISQLYFYALAQYLKTLEQRNNLLKIIGKGGKDKGTLEVWDDLLVEKALPVITERQTFLKRLSPLCMETHHEISGKKEILHIGYQGSVLGETAQETATAFKKELKKNLERDLRLGNTSVGPQKDDIFMKLGDIDLRYFGSQGQQRTAALALKLSELNLMKQNIGEYPILLLDDVLSELDETRQKQLLSKIDNVQTLITTTQGQQLFKTAVSSTEYRVINGTIKTVK